MINVVTIKWGRKYGPEYVNKLYRGVQEGLTAKHRFCCFTDDDEGIDKEIQTMPLYGNYEGWWNKMLLFRGLPGLHGRIIWLDLDTVITGNIDFLTEYNGNLAWLRDFYRPQFGASGAMLMMDGANRWVWHRFEQRQHELMKRYYGDQEVINILLQNEGKEADYLQDLWPDKIVSYKVHCQNRLPKEAAIVCFHGRPRPHEAESAWISNFWR